MTRPAGTIHQNNFLVASRHGMRSDWNISLFHYRNHGADYARVLAGMQVPRRDDARFWRSLKDLGYQYWDESENPAYRLFLA